MMARPALPRGGETLGTSSLIKSIYRNDLLKVSSNPLPPPNPSVPPPYLKPSRVSAHEIVRTGFDIAPSLCSFSHYGAGEHRPASPLVLIRLDTLSTRMNVSNGVCVWGGWGGGGRVTSAPLHKPHLSNSSALLLLEKNVAEIILFLSLSFSNSSMAVKDGCLKAPAVHNLGSSNDGWLSPWQPNQTCHNSRSWFEGQLFIFICDARHLASLVPLRRAASLLLAPFSLFQMYSHNPVFRRYG